MVMIWLSNDSGGWSLFFVLLVITISLVFGGLNVTSHFLAQLSIRLSSLLRDSAASEGSSTSINRHVSSEKSLILHLLAMWVRSFTSNQRYFSFEFVF